MAARFVRSYSALRDAKTEVARLNGKYEGTGKTFDWGTSIFTRQNPAPRTRPYVVYCREADPGSWRLVNVRTGATVSEHGTSEAAGWALEQLGRRLARSLNKPGMQGGVSWLGDYAVEGPVVRVSHAPGWVLGMDRGLVTEDCADPAAEMDG